MGVRGPLGGGLGGGVSAQILYVCALFWFLSNSQKQFLQRVFILVTIVCIKKCTGSNASLVRRSKKNCNCNGN